MFLHKSNIFYQLSLYVIDIQLQTVSSEEAADIKCDRIMTTLNVPHVENIFVLKYDM